MDLIDVWMLAAAGGAAGFVGGLLGVGGGLIFTPVLFFYFQSIGIPDEHVTPLAIGTGLLCTLVVALASAIGHRQKKAIEVRLALLSGLASVLAIFFTLKLITTSSWYTPRIYRVVFSAFLFMVASRMIWQSFSSEDTDSDPSGDRSAGSFAAEHSALRKFTSCVLGGSLAGMIASAVGVGGGIVLVPLYDRYLALPIRRAIGTSSATIVLITAAAVIAYMMDGSGLSITESSIGYVEFRRAIILSVPAALFAGVGVHFAHKTNQKRLRFIFAVLALLVALRLSLDAAGFF